jgi:hypothetical protein
VAHRTRSPTTHDKVTRATLADGRTLVVVSAQDQPGDRGGVIRSVGSYPMRTAKRGLMTSSINVNRSRNGMNDDFIALIVNRSRSLQP